MLSVKVPEDLAKDLVSHGLARPTTKPRGTAFEWLISEAGNISIWITLLQTPTTIAFYAEWLRKHARRNGGKTTMTISGARGSLHLINVRGDEELGSVIDKVKDYIDM